MKNNKHTKLIIVIVAVVVVISTVSYVGYKNIYLPNKLEELNYSSEEIELIQETKVVSEFVEVGQSSLMRFALKQDESNIERYEYFLIGDEELPSGSLSSIYNALCGLIEANYTSEEAWTLINNSTISEIETLLKEENPYPNDFDLMITALQDDYDLADAFYLANMDSEISSLIMDGTARYTIVKPMLIAGYSNEDVLYFINNMDTETMYFYSQMKYIPELVSLLEIDDYDVALLPRYLLAIRNEGLDYQEAVTYVNNNQDYVEASEVDYTSFYTDSATQVENTDSYTILVNQTNYLASDYVPSELVNLADYYGGGYLVQEAADAIIELAYSIEEIGYDRLIVKSGYVSYQEQQSLVEEAGYSEHQTGLAADLSGYTTGTSDFEDYEAYDWVIVMACDYGLIQRYPEGKEYLTGHAYEASHFRYVGVYAATLMNEYNWCLEEYCLLFD